MKWFLGHILVRIFDVGVIFDGFAFVLIHKKHVSTSVSNYSMLPNGPNHASSKHLNKKGGIVYATNTRHYSCLFYWGDSVMRFNHVDFQSLACTYGCDNLGTV